MACLSITAEAQREGLSLRAGTDLGLGWAGLGTISNRHILAFLQAHTCLSKDAGLLFCSHSGGGGGALS